jgi:hypothetical protein
MNAVPRWFARVGTPISDAERAGATAVLIARGQRAAAADAVILVPSWRAAAAWTDDHAMAECWDDDEDEREVLWTRAAAEIGEGALLAHLTGATSAAAPHVRAAALAAAGTAGAEDPEAVATACASALLALHQCVLAQAADAPAGHPFMHKYALFAGGRWALGYRDGVYGLY